MCPSRTPLARPRRVPCAAAFAVLLAACGNAPDAGPAAVPPAVSDAPTVKSAPAPLPAWTPRADASPGDPPAGLVRFEGCVADAIYVPRTGTPIRVSSLDGRPLGHATSGPQGGFSLRVVAQPAYQVAVDRDGGESTTVRAGRGDVWMTACMLDPER